MSVSTGRWCSYCAYELPEGRGSSDCPRCDGTGRYEPEVPEMSLTEALEWALLKVPKTGWKPEYELRFQAEYNRAVQALRKAKG